MRTILGHWAKLSIPFPGRLRWCAVALLLLGAAPARAGDAVTEWTLEADRLGRGGANWRTLAIMHMAMHDAINAARPVYARWAPPDPGEPPASGASPEAAMAGAAAQVLIDLHPLHELEIDAVFQNAMRLLSRGPGAAAGLALGRAIGHAAARRREDDGYWQVHAFTAGDGPGRWRPTPSWRDTSNTTGVKPFLFARRSDFAAEPPPKLGSSIYRHDVAEVHGLGGLDSPVRTEAQSFAATFWAYQSSQRGFVRLAVSLLDAEPRPGGLAEHARIMSQLANAMADSAIMVWAEKERFSFWRPITAIHVGGFGVTADLGWRPFIETPPFPEYPSGHASDCFTGAGLLTAVFGAELGPIDYIAQSAMPHAETAVIGMGQHAQVGGLTEVGRRFTSLEAAAQECALSRIWSGAHFRAADWEAHRLAKAIVARALAAVPPLARQAKR